MSEKKAPYVAGAVPRPDTPETFDAVAAGAPQRDIAREGADVPPWVAAALAGDAVHWPRVFPSL